ncbi:hypothetical protein AN958_07184 [Leucoagaricus sp. SymC.cos]|nr:hypothetical protein AN958_07184 [Leucoagaricus sp. SymC.cos]
MMEHDLVQFLSFLILLYPICLLAYWVGTVIPHLVVGLITSFYDTVIDPFVIVVVAFIFSSLDALSRYTCPQQPKVNFKVEVSLTHAPISATIYRIILRELKAHFINEVKVLLITGPLVLKLIEAPVVRKLIEASPLRLLIEGPPHRLLITGPPTRLFIEGLPVRGLITAPSTHLITGPPSRLLITGPSPRLPIIGPPSCLIEGPSPLLLIISSPVRLLIEGPLQRPLIAGSSTELLSDTPPTRKLVNGPPITLLIVAVSSRVLINYPTSLGIPALDEATSSQGEVVDEEVPASGIMVPEKVDESQTPPAIHNLASDWRSFMAADTLVVDDQVHCMVKELETGHSQVDDDDFLEYITLDSLKPIGRGGFGVLWKATGVYGEKYAGKVADRTKANDASLMKELAVLERACGSPWAIQMHHYDISEKQVLFVMVSTEVLKLEYDRFFTDG